MFAFDKSEEQRNRLNFFIAHISFKKIEILWGHLKIHAQEHYRATECLALATTNRIERKMREWNKRAFVLQ